MVYKGPSDLLTLAVYLPPALKFVVLLNFPHILPASTSTAAGGRCKKRRLHFIQFIVYQLDFNLYSVRVCPKKVTKSFYRHMPMQLRPFELSSFK